MNLDVPDTPFKEKMLVMKTGNGINAEHVATIVSAMFIEAGHDEFEHKLMLQHGRNSTFYLLGDLPDGFTFESMASSRWRETTTPPSVSTTGQRESRENSAKRCWEESSP